MGAKLLQKRRRIFGIRFRSVEVARDRGARPREASTIGFLRRF
jgi:hypothetical protein